MLSEMWGVRSFRRFGGLFDRLADVGASYGPSEGLRPPLDHIGDDHQSSMWPIALRSALVALSIVVTAQIGSAQDSSWTTSSQQSDPNGAVNPTRSRTTHSEVNGHVIEKTVTETLGPDGRYIPYSEVERESIRVNDSTTRSVERSYGRDADGRRSLTQQTQEESRSFSDGSKKMTRTTSNPDGNGALQVIQRAEIDSKVVSPGVRDTNTTMFSADGSGGLGATMRIEERERRTDPATVEYTKSTSLADGNGRWTVSETREGTTRQDPGGTTKEERVLRPNADGKMAVVERTVSKEPAGGQGGTVETYSRNVPGQAGDEGLKLVKRENTVQRSGVGGDDHRHGGSGASGVEHAASGAGAARARPLPNQTPTVAAQIAAATKIKIGAMTLDAGLQTSPGCSRTASGSVLASVAYRRLQMPTIQIPKGRRRPRER